MAPGVKGQERFTDLAQRGRRRSEETGAGWGTGTVVMPGTPKHPRPMWLVRAKAGIVKGGAA